MAAMRQAGILRGRRQSRSKRRRAALSGRNEMAGNIERPCPMHETSMQSSLPFAGTPNAIVRKLAAFARQGLKEPALLETYASLGARPVGSSPEEFAAYTRSEEQKWEKLIELAKVPKQ